MLKRMISVMLMALTLVVLLCACGGDGAEEKTFVLEDVYQSIMDAQSEESEALVMFPEADPAVVDSIYPGLSEIELTQQALYFPPIFGFASEIMLVEVTDKADVDAVKEIFQARIDRGASDVTYPENAEPWATRAQVQVEGRYVCMIVLPEGYTIPENVFAAGE